MSNFLVLSLLTAGLACIAQCQPAAAAGYQAPPRLARWETYLERALRLQQQTRYDEADAAYRAALADVERLGATHPAVARVLANLGTLQMLQHDYPAALSAFERSLGILVEKRRGPDHLEVGLLLANIAMLHHLGGRYAIAEETYRRALVILEKTVGPQNPNTAVTEAGLGKLLLVQRRNTDAEACFERAIPVLEKTQATGSADS